ncbi:MAG: RecX family transcriptional regulator [Candidatus Omnitrophica bacterium]|nr:RecX family transcriptional regulator [Candidatus Omnitrophota bacterium]
MKNFNKALNYAFLLLKYRARSKHEIVSRLKEKGYAPAIRERVVVCLEENNYIDDKKFVHLFTSHSLDKGWGPIRIDFNLKKLGISSQLRKQVLSGNFSFSDKVKEIIEEKLEYYQKVKPFASMPKIWQKIIMHLVRKGFDLALINQEIDNLGEKGFENE